MGSQQGEQGQQQQQQRRCHPLHLSAAQHRAAPPRPQEISLRRREEQCEHPQEAGWGKELPPGPSQPRGPPGGNWKSSLLGICVLFFFNLFLIYFRCGCKGLARR